jgi:hypothetical protein
MVLARGVMVALAAVAGFVVWKLATHLSSSTMWSWILTFGILALGIVVAVVFRRAQPASLLWPAVALVVTFGLIAAVNRSPAPPDNPRQCAARYVYTGRSGHYLDCVDRWHEYVQSNH